jgi:predicted RNA-binding protein YlxR (DUF448 family)
MRPIQPPSPKHRPAERTQAPMPRQEPERTCVVTRQVRDPADMIRFVLGPDNAVVPDLKCKLPGRGVWVGARATLVEEAMRRRLFARGLKAEAKASPTLAAEIDAALLQDLKGSLALANKAGAVTTGFTKVEAAIAKGVISALIHASDAAPDGRRKLAGALWKHSGGTISGLPIIDQLSSDELDMALGRVHVIHAALLTGAGGEGCIARWRRLQAYRAVGESAGHSDDVDVESDIEVDANERAASGTAGSEQDLVNE